MTLPNFLIVGTQKSGTTTLFDILDQHPNANMSNVKEINFFTSDKKYSRGLEYYATFFSESSKEQNIVGEASPGYMNYDSVPQRIKKDLGNIKIVMILRDPIKQAFSQYWDNRRQLSEFLTEDQIVEQYLTSNYSKISRGYFSRGVYIKYIEEYIKYFSREQIHIMIFEELIKDPKKELFELYNFLEINAEEHYLQLTKASNSSQIWRNPFYLFLLKKPKYTRYIPRHFRRLLFFGKKTAYKYPDISDSLYNRLQEFYTPWNRRLEYFLGRKIVSWSSLERR